MIIKLRRFSAAVLALLAAVYMSVPAWAYTVISPTDPVLSTILRDEGGYFKLLPVIPASTFSDEALSFWELFVDCLSGSGDYIPVITAPFKSLSSYPSLTFGLMLPTHTLSVESTYYGDPYVDVRGVQGRLMISLDPTTLQPLKYGFSPTLAGYSICQNNSYAAIYTCVLSGFDMLNNPPSSVIYANLGKDIMIEDDLPDPVPEPDPEPDPEPEPPPKPEPPVVTPPPDPVIPGGDKWVPYDTSIWMVVLKWLRGIIGNAINIGILIFGVVFATGLVVKIVRHLIGK